MRFVIVGAGAVGGTFGALLAKAGEDVVFVARRQHLRAMQDRGLRIEGRQDFTVKARAVEDPAEAGHADALLVCVKTHQTRDAVEPCRPLLRPDSIVVTMQNGLGNVERLALLLPGASIVPAVVYVASEVVAPGVIRWDAAGRIHIGPAPRSVEIRERFLHAGAGCEISPDIGRDVWEKLVANAVFNVLAAVENCSLGDLLHEPRRETAERAIDELTAVAATQGIVVRPSARESCWTFCRNFPTFRTSTQQDVSRGRENEAEALNGHLVGLGRKAGVATPSLDMLYRRLSMLNATAARPTPS